MALAQLGSPDQLERQVSEQGKAPLDRGWALLGAGLGLRNDSLQGYSNSQCSLSPV